MSDPFIAEIIMFGGSFAPRGWAFCSGQLQAISQNQALFSLVGTAFGGDGRTSFGLPDLRGRVPTHSGGGSAGPGLSPRPLGQKGGTETVTLTVENLPTHSFPVSTATGTETSPAGHVPAVANDGESNYAPESAADASTPSVGNGAAHDNMPPYLAVNFIIALVGVFPSRP